MKTLRSKEAASSVNVKTWPNIIDTGTEFKNIPMAFMFIDERSGIPDLTALVCLDDLPRKRPPQIYKPPTAEMLAYLDFSVSTTGMLTGVKARLVSVWCLSLNFVWSGPKQLVYVLCVFQISHSAVNALCRSIKLQCELYSSRQIAICMDPYCGLGFVLWCLSR